MKKMLALSFQPYGLYSAVVAFTTLHGPSIRVKYQHRRMAAPVVPTKFHE